MPNLVWPAASAIFAVAQDLAEAGASFGQVFD
jgi:hypothetical protein